MSDWDTLAANLRRMAVEFPKAARTATRKTATDTLGKVKANASGRPGPRRVTGDYTRTMNMVSDGDTSVVGTNAAQSLRLEHGYHGTDSIGRSYSQPPYEHWRPAAEWAGPRYLAAITDEIGAVIR